MIIGSFCYSIPQSVVMLMLCKTDYLPSYLHAVSRILGFPIKVLWFQIKIIHTHILTLWIKERQRGRREGKRKKQILFKYFGTIWLYLLLIVITCNSLVCWSIFLTFLHHISSGYRMEETLRIFNIIGHFQNTLFLLRRIL